MKDKIDYQQVIENDFEESLYHLKKEEVIKYLNNFGHTDFWTIIREVGGSERRMLRLLDQMTEKGYIKYADGKFFTKEKEFDRNIDEVREKLDAIWDDKPLPTLFFDQRPVTKETTLKRCEILLDNNDLNHKRIVLLGDDDLTSIALALTSPTAEITVLEADKRIVDFINEVSCKYHLNLKASEYNATSELALEYRHKFDVFMTDPTPERIPFTLFMNRGIELVNDNGVIYTSIYSSAMDKTLDLQRVINEMNLYITTIIPKFTEYQAIYNLYRDTDIELMNKYQIKFDENSICFTESLFRMEVGKETKTLPLEYQLKDIFGKATKRVIANDKKDVAKKSDYLNRVIITTKENKNKKYIEK